MTRLSSALHSSDLSHKETDCDADTLQAAGMAAQHVPLGVLLAEVLESACGDSGASVTRLRELNRVVCLRVAKWSSAWGIKVNSRAVGEMMVRECVLDRCERCSGRGFLPISYGLDVTETGGVDCPTCFGSGSGKRNHNARALAAGHDQYNRRLSDFWEDGLKRLTMEMASAKGYMTNKLHGN
jgi:hypothetical protein